MECFKCGMNSLNDLFPHNLIYAQPSSHLEHDVELLIYAFTNNVEVVVIGQICNLQLVINPNNNVT